MSTVSGRRRERRRPFSGEHRAIIIGELDAGHLERASQGVDRPLLLFVPSFKPGDRVDRNLD